MPVVSGGGRRAWREWPAGYLGGKRRIRLRFLVGHFGLKHLLVNERGSWYAE